MNLKQKVMYCLQKYPETRNSDIKLTNSIWYEFHNNKIKRIDDKNYVALTDLYDLPREDNVKRVRAKIQNEEGKYLPTEEEVLKQRKILEKRWREEYSPSNPSRG